MSGTDTFSASILKPLNHCHSILDLRERARRRLPAPVFHFLEGGAESEVTLRRNTTAFDNIQLRPRCLIDVTSLNTTTRILGQDLAWPVYCSPTGASRLFHPEGELAVARAAARTNTLYGVAAGATFDLESIAAASSAPKLFLLYPYKDRGLVFDLIDRAKAANYQALCLMVDAPAMGKRERDLRTGFASWPKWNARSVLSMALHPGWTFGQWRKGPVRLANLPRGSEGTSLAGQLDPSMTWDALGVIMERWGGPFALKGILAAEDARRAADIGINAIVVSNHGGRQLDGSISPIEALPEIAEAVGDRVELILDGGIRRGVHILKALALGAKACTIGRAYLYGLAAGGEAGVCKALTLLRSELELAMRLCGCTDVAAVRASMVRICS